MSRPVIRATYWFASSSGSGTYETLRYTDGTTSCSCPGWTRRVDKNGGRSCKHARMVEAGIGHLHATNWKENLSAAEAEYAHLTPTTAPKGKKATPPKPGLRKLILE